MDTNKLANIQNQCERGLLWPFVEDDATNIIRYGPVWPYVTRDGPVPQVQAAGQAAELPEADLGPEECHHPGREKRRQH